MHGLFKFLRHLSFLFLWAIFILIYSIFLIKPIHPEDKENTYPYKTYEEGDHSAIFAHELQDKSLKFYPLKKGMNINLNSIIVMPSVNEDGFLSIEFTQDMVTDKFINDLFYGQDKNVVNIHPFAHNGIEPILSQDKLILNIYSGVIIHLRNDMPYFPEYRTFKNEKITGTITQVKGKVSYSSDHQLIEEKLSDVYVWHVGPKSWTKPGSKIYDQPDGSFVVTIPFDEKTDIPPKYPTKILKD